MGYEEFKELFVEELEVFLKEYGNGEEISFNTIDKINGRYEFAVVGQPGSKIRPTINITDVYEKWNGSIKDTAREVGQTILDAIENHPEIPDFTLENARKCLYCEAINVDRNKQLLKEVPYKQIGDIALIARWKVDNNAMMTVTEGVCDNIGISQEEALEISLNNSKSMDYSVRDMARVIFDILSENENELEMPDDLRQTDIENAMYVITCRENEFGASAIAVPGVMEEVSQVIGGDFYILPSSRYELIAIPKEGRDVRELENMVREVNANELDAKDFLSDHVYQYDSKTKTVSMAEMEPLARQRAKSR